MSLEMCIRDSYKATNMIFFIQGNIDFKKVIRTIEKVTADIPFSITNRQRTAPFLYLPKTLTLNKETHQAHVRIGSRGYNCLLYTSPGTTAIRQPLDNLQNAGLIYGQIIYNKAPVMMVKPVSYTHLDVYKRQLVLVSWQQLHHQDVYLQ